MYFFFFIYIIINKRKYLIFHFYLQFFKNRNLIVLSPFFSIHKPISHVLQLKLDDERHFHFSGIENWVEVDLIFMHKNQMISTGES